MVPSSTYEQILNLERALLEADASEDPDTSEIIGRLLSSDAVIIGPRGESFSRQAVMDAHRPPQRQFFERVNVIEQKVKDLGSTVIVHSTTEYVKKDSTIRLAMVRVWHLRQGSWRIVSGTVSLIP